MYKRIFIQGEIMDCIKTKLGARIQELRKSKKLTQEKLAEIVGLDIPNISNIERGKKFVSSTTLEKIIKALDVTPNELFDFNHINSKEELLLSINDFLKSASKKDLIFFYRMIKIYKEL